MISEYASTTHGTYYWVSGQMSTSETTRVCPPRLDADEVLKSPLPCRIRASCPRKPPFTFAVPITKASPASMFRYARPAATGKNVKPTFATASPSCPLHFSTGTPSPPINNMKKSRYSGRGRGHASGKRLARGTEDVRFPASIQCLRKSSFQIWPVCSKTTSSALISESR